MTVESEAAESTHDVTHKHAAEQRRAKIQVYCFLTGCLFYIVGYIVYEILTH